MFKKLLFYANLFFVGLMFGQQINDYRSSTTGDWTSPSSWEYYNGTQWISATSYPGSTLLEIAGAVLIQQGHTIKMGPTSIIILPPIGTITIDGKLILEGESSSSVDFYVAAKKIIVTENLTPTATLEFLNKTRLKLPENATVNAGPDGLSGSCTNNNEIWIGGVIYSVCKGGGSLINFDGIMALGGTGNAYSNTPVCTGNQINLHATTPPNGDNYTFEWTGPNAFSSTLKDPIISNAQSDVAGEYKVVMHYAGNSIEARTTVEVNNGSAPSPPTIGAITSDCTSTTGSVVLNGLPTSGIWKVRKVPEGEEKFGTGSSTTFTGLTAGSYTFTVSNGGCNSLPSNTVVISSTSTHWKSDAENPIWNNDANWTCGIPSSNSDVTIELGTYQPIISSTVNISSLKLNSGTTLKVSSGFNLKVTGAIVNDGTLTVENNSNLVQSGDTDMNSGSGSAIIKRESIPLYRLDYIMWSTPVTGSQHLLDFSPLTTPTRFYTYNPLTDLYNLISNPESTTFTKGIGYLIRMPNTSLDPNYDAGTATEIHKGEFIGMLNNGPVTLSGLIPDAYYAVGNPYPSTIYAATFNIDNPTTGTFYFWRKKNNSANSSYATYTDFAGVSNSGDPNGIVPNGIIQVGQGFIVKPTTTELHFKNFMRTQNNSNQIFKTKAKEKHRIWLNLSEGSNPVNQIAVGYMSGATMDVDYVDGAYINDSKTALTSLINDKEFVIQARGLPFDGSDVIPLAFKTTLDGNYTIAIDHFDGLFSGSQDIILRDNTTGIETDLKAGSYTFAAKAGEDKTRFSLKFEKTLGVHSQVLDNNSVLVYKNKGSIAIKSSFEIENVKIYDIQGRLLIEKKKVNAQEARIESSKFAKQVLIVQITSKDNKVVNKKVN